MIQLVKDKEQELKLICEHFSVAELYLFGSALTENFKKNSDLDFAVLFREKLDKSKLPFYEAA